MTNKYIIQFIGRAEGRYRVVYKNSKFARIERLTGELNQKQHDALMTLVPRLESGIDGYIKKFKEQVKWNVESGSGSFSLYNEMVGEYKSWYLDRHQINYMMSKIAGNCLKQIIVKLKEQCADETEVLAVWKLMLSNWDKQEDFYKRQDELKQINGNLNTILKVIKHGKQETGGVQQAHSFASKYRSNG